MILSNVEIKELILSRELVTGYADLDKQLQPASFDFRLMDELYYAKTHNPDGSRGFYISGVGVPFLVDPMDQDSVNAAYAKKDLLYDVNGLPYWIIEPGEFLIGSTMESLNMPNDLVCEADGRSSIGRLGLTIHQTAGYVDPGFTGRVTLEIKNESPHRIKIWPTMRVGQFIFNKMFVAANPPYTGRYQNQQRPEISRYSH